MGEESWNKFAFRRSTLWRTSKGEFVTTNDRAAIFLAGMGIGIAGALWFAPREGQETRRRIQTGASGLFEKAKDGIDEAAGATKRCVDQVVDRSKDFAHSAGKKMEEAGKRLQDA